MSAYLHRMGHNSTTSMHLSPRHGVQINMLRGQLCLCDGGSVGGQGSGSVGGEGSENNMLRGLNVREVLVGWLCLKTRSYMCSFVANYWQPRNTNYKKTCIVFKAKGFVRFEQYSTAPTLWLQMSDLFWVGQELKQSNLSHGTGHIYMLHY